MIAAIVASALAGATLGAGLTALLRPRRPPVPPRVRWLLDDAAGLLARLRQPTDLDHVDVLSDPSKTATDRWLNRYRKEFPA